MCPDPLGSLARSDPIMNFGSVAIMNFGLVTIMNFGSVLGLYHQGLMSQCWSRDGSFSLSDS